MPPFDGKAMAADVLAAVRDYVARAIAPLQAKIEAMPSPKDGKDGANGTDGKDGSDGINGEDGELGKDGANGKDGEPGKDGTDGRDAAQLEIAAAIDTERTYPRGTYAKHANGLWRAFEQTQGMRGWECLVAGVAGIEVLCTHEREFKVVHTLSDGKEFAQTFELPVLIYRGVFVDGREYHRGDQVSWGAHQWHCNEQTTEKPIEGGKAWTLAVKRGRDGKEGPPGPPGKDRVVVKEISEGYVPVRGSSSAIPPKKL